MNRGLRMILLLPLVVVGMALFAFLGGQLVKALWNWVAPPLFGWRTVTFWQALALLALCRILFGGIGFHPSRRSRMAPEERERFRRRVRETFGFAPRERAGHSPEEMA